MRKYHKFGCDCDLCRERVKRIAEGEASRMQNKLAYRYSKAGLKGLGDGIKKIKARKPFPGQIDLFDDDGNLNVNQETDQ